MAKNKTDKSKSVSSAKRTRRRNIHSTYKRLTPKQKLTLYLNDALAIENAAVQRLQSRIKQTEIENAKQRLQLHLQETREQQNRLKHLISDLSSGKSATKD